jgi:pyruvate,water dikinase
MSKEKKSWELILETLKERAKELNCIYSVEEALKKNDISLAETFQEIVEVLPPGWQYPDVCEAKLEYQGEVYKSSNFKETIKVQEKKVGTIKVFYTEERLPADEGPFLKEERKLINSIADRLGHFLLHQNLKEMIQDWKSAKTYLSQNGREEWRIIVDLLHRTDQDLYIRISRKMMNYLSWHGIEEAQKILLKFIGQDSEETDQRTDSNRPQQKAFLLNTIQLSDEVFKMAAAHLNSNEIYFCVQKWIHEDKSNFLIRTLENQHSSLSEISDSINRFYHLAPEGVELSDAIKKAVNVSLVRRFFTDQLEFINIAKNYVDVSNFHDMLKRMIYPPGSQGKLGGKSAGLFLAYQILNKKGKDNELCHNIKIPKTWYISSDGLLEFLHHNNLEEVIEQKYKEIDQIRQEYPHIIQLFKNSTFPPEIVNGLSMVLDDIGDKPLIVRSSSLLEDRLGSAFSGKYKSLFLANQGDKEDKLNALQDAIAEVYASTFGSDPIGYRLERGLLDFHEEMGVMIQEVVGKQVQHYFIPAYAGVAFTNNEFRWSPRINREDGLLRIVPGLGTRAVDRLSDDYPILIAPGQPNLRVNISPDEVIRYSPKNIDVINLDNNTFETKEIKEFFSEVGNDYPQINNIVSIVKDDHIQKPIGLGPDFEKDEIIVTFEGVVSNTFFINQVKTILNILNQTLKSPVDIEFAHDGEDFYLLQCRPQSFILDSIAMPIPQDIPEKDIIFSANKYISNGIVPDITHIVYVDPEKYAELDDLNQMKEVGRAIGKLNKVLPKRCFILMGPGRWGSRGDIKLGVSVTYTDINNSAVLIEIARKKGNYLPDLSFGTHFFQDLVESAIRYLPLYPDDEENSFNEQFLRKSPNILKDITPEYEYLSEVIRVIDIPNSTNGSVLRVLLNADIEKGLAMLTSPEIPAEMPTQEAHKTPSSSDENWRWRLRMAHQIASKMAPKRFGVKGLYVIGSTKNANAGPASDIDLLIHFNGNKHQKADLDNWLEGWSLCLAEMNYLRTGYKTEGLLDIHYVTDEDIQKKTNYAMKINAITDAAMEIPLRK